MVHAVVGLRMDQYLPVRAAGWVLRSEWRIIHAGWQCWSADRLASSLFL